MPSKRSKKKTKLSTGTKENIDTIITELSIIIGRKGWPKDEPGKVLGDAFKNVDAHIAAVSLVVPDIDPSWYESGAREAFLRIRRNRKRAIGFLITIAVIVALFVLVSAIVAVLLIDDWYKWVILLGAALVLFLGSSSIPKYIMGPYMVKKDLQIPEKFNSECVLINKFVKDLIQLRRKS
ncbi:MAG: hypothetical protein E3J70_03055 [Candidatus Heimdallarchaeota archaeon]|nr:MAG: hypothetical protein E3J70_03055 [Candidatus Heimdallarchaeota archaeon]